MYIDIQYTRIFIDEYRHFANHFGGGRFKKSAEAFKQHAQRAKAARGNGLAHSYIFAYYVYAMLSEREERGGGQEKWPAGCGLSLLLAALRYGCLIKSFA